MIIFYTIGTGLLLTCLFYWLAGRFFTLRIRPAGFWQVQVLLTLLISVVLNSMIPYPVFCYILAAYIFIILLLFFKGPWKWKLFLAVFGVYHILIIEGIVFCCLSLLLSENLSMLVNTLSWRYLAAGHTFLISLVLLLILSRGRLWERAMALFHAERVWNMLLVGTFPVFLLLTLMTSVYYMSSVPAVVVWIFLLVCTMHGAVFYLFAGYMTGVDRVLAEREKSGKILTLKLTEQLKNYELQADYINIFRRFRYDYSAQIKGLVYLLEMGDYNDAKAYLERMTNHLVTSEAAYHQYSSNQLVDAILQETFRRCTREKIHFEAMVDIKNNFLLSDLELCTVFSNILDNAFEAVVKLPEKERFIELESSIRGGWQAVTCKNSFDGTILMEEGEYKTRKEDPDSHGIGLKKITDSVERNGGIVTIESENQVFAITICIPVNGKSD